MSWSYQKVGKAGRMAEVVKGQIEAVQGCPNASAEESAKNLLGGVFETLCKSLPTDKAVRINASGSAWNQKDGTALSQHLQVTFEVIGELVD